MGPAMRRIGVLLQCEFEKQRLILIFATDGDTQPSPGGVTSIY